MNRTMILTITCSMFPSPCSHEAFPCLAPIIDETFFTADFDGFFVRVGFFIWAD